MANKELIPLIYKEHLQTNKKKMNNSILGNGQELLKVTWGG